jgi:thioredoxin-dependent peroxiredoxin
VILGASYDPPRDNLRFSDDQELPFALLSDQTGAVAATYGVRRPPGSRWADVPERRTFLVDPAGTVREVYDVADVHAHPGEVLADLERLVAGDAGPGGAPGPTGDPA